MRAADAEYMGNIIEGLRALSAVQKVFPSAILAGGYLRDAFYGRQQKDIDIFVDFVSKDDNPTLQLLEGLGEGSVEPMYGCMYTEMGDVNSIWNVKGYALPCQVIMLNKGCTAMSRALEHDFDFCQIWHDGWTTGCTAAFTLANMGEVTLVHCEDQKEFDRSMRRWTRLQAKYPDCRLVIPPRFAEFIRPA